MTDIILNGPKLHAIATANKTAEELTLYVAGRERNARNSKLNVSLINRELLFKGKKIVEQDVMQYWKSLQDAGVGALVYGKNEEDARFEWHYSMKLVAQAALEGKDTTLSDGKALVKPVRRKPKVVRKTQETPAPTPPQAAAPKQNTYVVHVREGLNLTLSESDAKALSEALKNIAA